MTLRDLEFIIRPFERVVLYDQYNHYLFDNYWAYCRFMYRVVQSIYPVHDSSGSYLKIRIGGQLVDGKEISN